MNNDFSNCCMSIFEEDGALITATKHEWKRLPEEKFEAVQGFQINAMFCGTGGIFLIIRDFNIGAYMNKAYKLLKITTDKETGKCISYVIDLTEAEAQQLMMIRSALWE